MTTKAGDTNRRATRALSRQAQRLTESGRLMFAAELVESLEGPSDDATDEEWLAEINRRADRVRRGESVGAPWSVVRNELLAELRK